MFDVAPLSVRFRFLVSESDMSSVRRRGATAEESVAEEREVEIPGATGPLMIVGALRSTVSQNGAEGDQEMSVWVNNLGFYLHKVREISVSDLV